GARQSAADAYIRPFLDRPNLDVVTDATVQRLRITGGRCTGVEYVVGGVHLSVESAEVILTAGAVGSAHLLMLSGIGPARHLGEHGIGVVADLPGVGSHLQDHPLAGVVYEASRPVPFVPANPPAEMTGLLYSDPAAVRPDLQVYVVAAPLPSAWGRPPANGYSIAFSAMAPHSSGTVRLADADPASAPVLDRNRPDEGLDLAVGEGGVVLDVLVRAQGRVNYGPLLDDRKGIWRGVRHGHQQLFEWEIRPLPLTDLAGLRWSPQTGDAPRDTGRPAFHRFTHALPGAPADGFLDVGGWGTGLVWLNGFLLGHYDTPRGPQRTLYAPAPLWRTGRNEIVLLELERPGADLPLRDAPDLGRPTVVTLE
ncbi:GMC family oxidoreductase, partial [Streptomyces sp. NPDC001193]